MMESNRFMPWTDVRITGGFWKKWQENVAENTSKAIYDRFKETGRIDAMKLEWKEGMANKPHVFWDSDIAKWMEGSAYLLYFREDEKLRERLETVIGYIEQGQTAEGYFNSAFLTLEPDKCFTDRTNHELYTAGHFIEAAVAHYYSTGSERFLNIVRRFADYIEKRFYIQKDAGFWMPGHQELELALARLWEATGEKRYLELSKYFVDMRGRKAEERVFSVKNGTFPADPPKANQLFYNDTYAQDDAPARELPAAAGHAVRAMYFYSAMADLAREYEEEELYDACERLWNDSVTHKMYITGGVSAERYGEAIGTDYVLPNDYAYAETCASVAMANFSQRMFRIEPDGKYMDMVERQMYNGTLAGLSMDGKAFYYDNALQCRPEVNDFFAGIHALPLLPPYQRQEIFECSCCPPNVYRFIAALGQYFYSVGNGKIYIHQYGESETEIEVDGHVVKIYQKTDYPWDGAIKISFWAEDTVDAAVAARIPKWCAGKAKVKVNGMPAESIDVEKGYVYIRRVWKTGDDIELFFPMDVVKMEGNPHIVEDVGKVALMRGPLVYCVEGKDNGFSIFDLTLGMEEERFHIERKEVLGYSLAFIKGKGMVRDEEGWKDVPYRPFEKGRGDWREVEFTAIPYFAWANRGANDMTVWIKHMEK